MRNNVEVIGGYSGQGNQRSTDPSKTILSGDIGTKDDNDNVYHVFYHPNSANLDNTAKLENVTITKGNAKTAKKYYDYGGGMYNNESSPTLTTVTFTSNSARKGGGMHNYTNSSPRLTNCRFTDNKANEWAGGMSNSANSSPTLTDCTFTGNTAKEGGGMYNQNGSSPTLNSCTFTNNRANDKGGAVYSDKDSNPIFEGTTESSFTKTDTTNPYGKDNGVYRVIEIRGEVGKGIHVWINAKAGGNGLSWQTAYNDLQKAIEAANTETKKRIYVAQGIYKPTSHPNGGSDDRAKHFSLRNGVSVIGGYSGDGDVNDPDVYETVLSGDIGKEGDDTDNAYHVFYHPSSAALTDKAKLLNVTITKGNANGSGVHGNGGGMYNHKSSPKLTNCKFKENVAKTLGGGMFNHASSPTLTRCTFTNNRATIAGGAVSSQSSSNPTFDTETESTFTPLGNDPDGKNNGRRQ